MNLDESLKCHVSAIQKFSHPTEIIASWKYTKYGLYGFIWYVIKNIAQDKTKDTF